MIARLTCAAAFLLLIALSSHAQRASAQATPPPAASPLPSPSATNPASPFSIPIPAPTGAPIAKLTLDADSTSFYFNRYLIEADGHVMLKMDDGTVVTGDAFSMDLRLNRFLVAGHVHLQTPRYAYDGAAFAEFLQYDRGYFIPILSEPDRWTFIERDYSRHYPGREMPGDAFNFPNVGGSPFLYAKSATIWPADAMLFNDARVRTVGSLYAPAGRIYLNFSANPNFHQNSLAGATATVGYPFAGGRFTYSNLLARYDPINKTYLSFEQHFAWNNAYVVASVNPFDRFSKQYNLLASDRLSRNFQVDLFSQLINSQSGWTTPCASAYFGSYSLTAALKNSYFKFMFNQYNDDLLADPGTANSTECNGQSYFDPTHPVNVSLAWNGVDHELGHLPISYRLRSGISTYHNGYGLGSFNGTPYVTLWSTLYGLTLYTHSIRVGPQIYFVASFDKQRTFFSLPHYLDSETTTASLTRLVGTKAAFSVTYQNTNSGDFAGSQQLAIYPPSAPVDPSTGLPAQGYAAFIGFATSRTMSYLATYNPNPNLTVSFNYQHYRDFPVPVSLILGRPPNYFNADVKFRLTPQLAVEASRAYYFNWFGAKWAPQLSLQFTP